MSEYVGQDSGTLKVTIREAAARLGVTEAAIRKRIQRGSLDKEMGQDGKVYVSLDLSQDKSHPESQVDSGALVESLQDQVAFLRSQLDVRAEEIQRRDVIISQLTQANAALTERMREIEAPSSEQREPSMAPSAVQASVAEGGKELARRFVGLAIAGFVAVPTLLASLISYFNGEQLLAGLAAAFGVLTGLLGTYVGVRASADTREETEEQRAERRRFEERTARASEAAREALWKSEEGRQQND